MQAFIFLIAFLIVCLAKRNTDVPPKVILSPFEFIYNWSQELNAEIKFKNFPPDLTNLVIATQYGTFVDKTDPRSETQWYIPFQKRLILKQPLVSIDAELYNKEVLCDKVRILHGIMATTVMGKPKNTSYSYDGTCLKPESCLIEVDLRNKCLAKSTEKTPRRNASTITKPVESKITLNNDTLPTQVKKRNEIITTNTTKYNNETTDESPEISQNPALTYGVASVVAACVLLLLVCVCIRRYRNKNTSQQIMDLNTYSTTNCVLYADLGLAPNENHTPAHVEESPYAEIIGVLEDFNRNGNK